MHQYQRKSRKKSPRESTTSQPAAGSHGSLFLSTSLNFHTVNILSLRARGELWRRSKFAQIRSFGDERPTIVTCAQSPFLPVHSRQSTTTPPASYGFIRKQHGAPLDVFKISVSE